MFWWFLFPLIVSKKIQILRSIIAIFSFSSKYITLPLRISVHIEKKADFRYYPVRIDRPVRTLANLPGRSAGMTLFRFQTRGKSPFSRTNEVKGRQLIRRLSDSKWKRQLLSPLSQRYLIARPRGQSLCKFPLCGGENWRNVAERILKGTLCRMRTYLWELCWGRIAVLHGFPCVESEKWSFYNCIRDIK